MMRVRLALLTLLVATVALVASSAFASAPRPPNAAGLDRANASSGGRSWSISLSAAPDDLALAEISFHHAAQGQRITASSLQPAVSGPVGDDYLLAGTVQRGTAGVPRALVLLVNRPSPLLDPVSVHVRLSARRALGVALVSTLADPFTHPLTGPTSALCDLSLHGSPLGAHGVRLLYSRGHSLVGFDGASALAQAYDVVCGLPSAASFAQAVGQSSSPTPTPPPSPAPTPPPSPAPVPTPGPPGCTPCDPAPGYACPLAVQPDVCAASVRLGGRQPAPSAH